MDDLPSSIVIEILSRLPDCSDLARCRLASTTLNSLSRHVSSLRLLCPHRPPFRSLVTHQIARLEPATLRSLLVAVGRPSDAAEGGEDYDEADDRHLTDPAFVALWLPRIAGSLTSLAIHDFWPQSCWRPSEVLALISDCCDKLVDLDLRCAWLTVAALKPLPSLRSLTLEFIRLDDERLLKINECFPRLEVLNLIGVGGLTDPKIHLLHLTTCRWTVSNFPTSLSVIAPSLLHLNLHCVEPKHILLRAPSLASLSLTVEKQAPAIDVESLAALRSLRIQTPAPRRLLQVFAGSTSSIKSLELEAPAAGTSHPNPPTLDLGDLVMSFPDLCHLGLSHSAWNELARSLLPADGDAGAGTTWCSLRKLVVQLLHLESSISSSLTRVLETCTGLSEVLFLLPNDVPDGARNRLVAKLSKVHHGVRWRCADWNHC